MAIRRPHRHRHRLPQRHENPPSLLFAAIGNPLVLIGRVPFAFYVAHFFLLHVLSIGLGGIQSFRASQMLTLSFAYPKGYGLDLPGVYLV